VIASNREARPGTPSRARRQVEERRRPFEVSREQQDWLVNRQPGTLFFDPEGRVGGSFGSPRKLDCTRRTEQRTERGATPESGPLISAVVAPCEVGRRGSAGGASRNGIRCWDGRTNGCPKRSISAKDGWLPLPS
jgi:hypothetical protein